MVRWQPDARERLAKAALELFSTKGFDETTVSEIAVEAGLTERTFYRYFADKREVIFGGQAEFQQVFLDAIDGAPAGATALDVVFTAIAAACNPVGMFSEERRPYSRMRQSIIAAHPELRERDLLKMSTLSRVLADALRARGIGEPAASLAAESGVMVFRLSFAEWIAPESTRPIDEIEQDVRAALRTLSAAG